MAGGISSVNDTPRQSVIFWKPKEVDFSLEPQEGGWTVCGNLKKLLSNFQILSEEDPANLNIGGVFFSSGSGREFP